MAVYKKVPGHETVNISTLEFDETPTPGSLNPVTSGGVAESVAQQSSNIAEAFSASSTYAIGEVVIGPDGKLYQCTTAVETSGEWDPDDWTESSMGEQVALMNAELVELEISMMRSIPISKGMRFVFSKKDYNPVEAGIGSGTWKRVGKYANIWDFNRAQASWSGQFSSAFSDSENLVSVIAADVSHVTSFQNLFNACPSMTECCDLNSSSCTSFYQMFNRCTSLSIVGTIDTTSATNVNDMFFTCSNLTKIPDITGNNVTSIHNFCSYCNKITRLPTISSTIITDCEAAFRACPKVETGALDMYNQLSSQSTPPTVVSNCFKDCGISTTSGVAELAQIPASWGGTGPEPTP